MSTERMGFGFVSDNDDKLVSKGFGFFGLNQGCTVTKLEFNADGGKGGSEAHCIDFEIMTADKPFNKRLYDITGDVWYNNELVGEDDENYDKGYNAQWIQNSAWLTHIVKGLGVTEEEIKDALSAVPATFQEWAEIMCDLAAPHLATAVVDIFLEYESKLGKNNKITFLTIPTNMKGGYWICPAMEGVYEAKVKDGKGMKYRNETGEEHPFFRDDKFMKSTKAIQQKKGGETDDENFEEEAEDDGFGTEEAQEETPKTAQKKTGKATDEDEW